MPNVPWPAHITLHGDMGENGWKRDIITIPIRSQYEQQCNAAALKQLGILKLKSIDADFKDHLCNWTNEGKALKMDYSKTVPLCLEYLFANVPTQEEMLSII